MMNAESKKDSGIRLILFGILVFITFCFANRLSYLVRFSSGNALEKSISALTKIPWVLNNIFLLSFYPVDLLWGGIGGLIVGVLVSSKQTKTKKKKTEYGTAEWAKPEEIIPYTDPIFDNNIILTKTERLSMNPRMKDWRYNRNKNVLVIGDSGAGKTRYFIKPNICQMHSSYVITDPKGTLIEECGEMLKKGKPLYRYINKKRRIQKDASGMPIMESYEIKVFNTLNFDQSMHYNPFAYVKTESDMLVLVDTMIANTQGLDEKMDFWVKSEKMLYMALIGYMFEVLDRSAINFGLFMDLVKMAEPKSDGGGGEAVLDQLFNDLKKNNPNSFAYRQYMGFKSSAEKSAQSILMSCNVRLMPFDIQAVRDLMEFDEMELDLLGDRKTALFLIISDTNPTFNFIVAMMYSQLFNMLCDRALNKFGGSLPVPVRLLLDEFANIGKIPNFDKLIAVFRSRNISASIILQEKTQLKTLYKDASNTIIGNCNSQLFLGGTEESTLKSMSEMLGKQTIEYKTINKSMGSSKSYSQNVTRTGRALMTTDELLVLPNEMCILQIRGARPFLSEKFPLEQHERYRMLSDYDESNRFDLKREILRLTKHPLTMLKNDELLSYFLTDLLDITTPTTFISEEREGKYLIAAISFILEQSAEPLFGFQALIDFFRLEPKEQYKRISKQYDSNQWTRSAAAFGEFIEINDDQQLAVISSCSNRMQELSQMLERRDSGIPWKAAQNEFLRERNKKESDTKSDQNQVPSEGEPEDEIIELEVDDNDDEKKEEEDE